MYAVLDGKYVGASKINPAEHAFIGMFRAPNTFSGGGVMLCTCGESLWGVRAVREHWQSGHHDVAQHVSLATAVATKIQESATPVGIAK